MTRKEYERFVSERCHAYVDLNYCVIALNGEAGEVAEWHKKFNLRGNPGGKLSHQDLLREIGDVLFYLTRLAQVNGWSLSDVMDENQAKLLERQRDFHVPLEGQPA